MTDGGNTFPIETDMTLYYEKLPNYMNARLWMRKDPQLTIDEAMKKTYLSLTEFPNITMMLFSGFMGPVIQEANPDLYRAVWDRVSDKNPIKPHEWQSQSLSALSKAHHPFSFSEIWAGAKKQLTEKRKPGIQDPRLHHSRQLLWDYDGFDMRWSTMAAGYMEPRRKLGKGKKFNEVRPKFMYEKEGTSRVQYTYGERFDRSWLAVYFNEAYNSVYVNLSGELSVDTMR